MAPQELAGKHLASNGNRPVTTAQLRRRFRQSWFSFRSLPLWVQIWVGALLVPANAAAFLLLGTWAGRMAAWAALFVVLTNAPIMLHAGGMSKLMSVPHLLAWISLETALLRRLAQYIGPPSMPPSEIAFAAILLAINGASLVFDARDSWQWLRGHRAIPATYKWNDTEV